MHHIPPHSLWIGTTGDLRDLRQLYDVGMRAVVQLAYEETPVSLPHDLIACRFPLVDGDDNSSEMLEVAITTLTHLLEQKFATLVCCQAGLSRSPAIAAAALARRTGAPFADCVTTIHACRPVAIHPGLRAAVETVNRPAN